MYIRKRTWRTPKSGQQRKAYVLVYTDAEGKERWRQFDTRKAAQAAMVEVGSELADGTHTPASAAPTVRDAAGAWLRYCEHVAELRRATVENYRDHVDRWIAPKFGDARLPELSTPGIQHWLDELAEAGVSRDKLTKIRGAFVMLLNRAELRGQIRRNAAEPTKVPRGSRRNAPADVPEPADVKALLAWLTRRHDDAGDAELARIALPIVETLINTGLRISELRGLARPHLDLAGGAINVVQSADKRRNTLQSPKSDAAWRRIPISDRQVQLLRAWLLAAPPSPRHELVFPSSTGGPHWYNNLRNRLYQPVMVKSGLVDAWSVGFTGAAGDDKARDFETLAAAEAFAEHVDGRLRPVLRFPLHHLRHFAASLWIDEGAHIKRLQTWLGHASAQTTLDIYGHLFKSDHDRDRAFMGAVADRLYGKGG